MTSGWSLGTKKMEIKDYKDLRIWQKGIELVNKTYSVTEKFPNSELYGLTSQMRRAAVSIPSNIAEGFVRKHTKEYSQFLSISLGSCAELDTQVIISAERKYISKDLCSDLTNELYYEMRMISSLLNKL